MKIIPGHRDHAATLTEAAMRFCLWAQQQHGPLTYDRVQAHTGCSRATAYRWIRAYHDAAGIPREPPRYDRMPLRQEVEICLRRRRCTVAELAAELESTPSSVHNVIWQLRKDGIQVLATAVPTQRATGARRYHLYWISEGEA